MMSKSPENFDFVASIETWQEAILAIRENEISDADILEHQIQELRSSTSWRITRPIRLTRVALRKIKRFLLAGQGR